MRFDIAISPTKKYILVFGNVKVTVQKAEYPEIAGASEWEWYWPDGPYCRLAIVLSNRVEKNRWHIKLDGELVASGRVDGYKIPILRPRLVWEIAESQYAFGRFRSVCAENAIRSDKNQLMAIWSVRAIQTRFRGLIRGRIDSESVPIFMGIILSRVIFTDYD